MRAGLLPVSTGAHVAVEPILPLPRRINRDCLCATLERDALHRSLDRAANDPQFSASHLASRPHLFADTPLFVSAADISAMLATVRAIEAAARVPAYQAAALAWAPAIAGHDHGPLGAFMGYDFHLADEGPKLIEINTNAGGAFLNAALAGAQRACCPELAAAQARSRDGDFEAAVLSMFRREWRLQRAHGAPRRIAIVDDAPEAQFLYPEFLLARSLLERNGIETVIADAGRLAYEQGRLHFEGLAIDLVYNRLVDFALAAPGHEALAAAYADGSVVLTPNPRVHALLADKRNLCLLSDRAARESWGLPADALAALAALPRAVSVRRENAEALWQARKRLVFKPATGHGSKGVYRGDKLTKSVWAAIVGGQYVAQAFAVPGERLIGRDGAPATCKTDIRLYTYAGKLLLAAARLYQGQATNFRTPGGGFAPVLEIDEARPA